MKFKLLLLVFLVCLFGCNDGNSQKAAQHAKPSPEKQAERTAFIQKLINMEIVHKVEVPASLPHVFVADGFYLLSFDDKESFIEVILAYHMGIDPKRNIVVLKDFRTGKQIGELTKYGLVLN